MGDGDGLASLGNSPSNRLLGFDDRLGHGTSLGAVSTITATATIASIASVAIGVIIARFKRHNRILWLGSTRTACRAWYDV